MLKLIAKTIAGVSLMLTASVAAPAWSADKAAPAQAKKCPKAKKAQAVRPGASAQPARGISVVEKRKLDVQILSFGP